MDEFTVYKDIVLYLRKVFFRSLYEQDGPMELNNGDLDGG